MKSKCIWGMLLLVGMTSIGCGGNPGPTGGPREKTYPVTGIIHVNGAPAEGVDIAFVPQADATTKRTSSGMSNSEGKFAATTYTGNDGLPEGTYKLTFVFDTPEPQASVLSERKDRLNGAYKDAANSKIEVSVKGAKVDLGVIELSTGS